MNTGLKAQGLFTSKAATLAYLQPQLQSAQILPLFIIELSQWQDKAEALLQAFDQLSWAKSPLIVRSSASDEDQSGQSKAGHYLSLGGVMRAELPQAIEQVIAAYDTHVAQQQLFIQPFLTEVSISGVLFSHEPNTGAPYLVINYDDHSQRTDTVTSGCTNALRTRLIHRQATHTGDFSDLLMALQELENLTGNIPLDIEFARDQQARLYILQVRPLACQPIDEKTHYQQLKQLEAFVESHLSAKAYLLGSKGVLGVMPDWNPAEIIGIRPRPLARTLYQELVTDQIWAYQRDNYGYRNLRSFPLMLNLMGCPYIDVRVSFNSFIPADLPTALAEKLVDYYLDALLQSPAHHDKVEFDILYSCYSLDLPQRMTRLEQAGFTTNEREVLMASLRVLTQRIIDNTTGLWIKDRNKIDELDRRWHALKAQEMPTVARIYWLLEDCKRYGTLPFAGLARSGFIAIQMLRSLVNLGILSEQEYHLFFTSLNTVTSAICTDLQALSEAEFLKKYGHLRPGTYDILSLRYDEAPELYFSAPQHLQKETSPSFVLSMEQLKAIRSLLQSQQLDIDVIELFEFIKAAIEGREYAKFIFTRHLSEALQALLKLAAEHDLSRDDLSYLDIALIQKLYSGALNLGQELQDSITQGKQNYAITTTLVLPPLLSSTDSLWEFELYADKPNFITLKKICGPVLKEPEPGNALHGAIVCISQADPGYDWLFSHSIAALITCYGGVNSHMAIRAAELGIPAVIGAGQVLYQSWTQAHQLEIDCANQQVKIL